MKKLLRFIQIIYNIYAILVFLIFVLILFPIVLFALLLPKKTRGNLIYTVCRWLIDVVFLILFISHKIIEEHPHDSSKPSIFVFNHISYLDAFVILKAIRKQKITIASR